MANMSVSKIGVGRYVQGGGSISYIGKEAKNLGTNALIIGGETALSLSLQQMEKALIEEGVNFNVKINKGFCSYENLELFSEAAVSKGADMIIGVGGGKSIDLSKAVAMKMKMPIITVPTIAATCAAWAPLSIMYTQNGSPLGSLPHEHEINCCISDTDIIANAPERTLASGIADSFAKSEEIANGAPQKNIEDTDVRVYTAYRLAKVIDEILYNKALNAYNDCKNRKASSILNDVVYANIAITGVCSGFASGSNQLAMAHTFNNALRTGYTELMNEHLHGEVVGVGIIVQMYYNESPFINSYKEICRDLNLPTTIRQLNITPNEEAFDYILKFTLNRMQIQDDGIIRIKAGLIDVFQ